MNLRQMEIFLRVTECESFLEAANSLFMSQSAVSQQIIRNGILPESERY